MNLSHRRSLLLPAALLLFACPRPPEGLTPPPGGLLHLTDHLSRATVTGGNAPEHLPPALEWRFDHTSTPWRATPAGPKTSPATFAPAAGAHRLGLHAGTRERRGFTGALSVPLPPSHRADFESIVIHARTSASDATITVWFNRREGVGDTTYDQGPFALRGDAVTLLGDGKAHRYRLRADWPDAAGHETSWRELGLMVTAGSETTIDLLDVAVLPKEARFAGTTTTVSSEARGGVYRRSLATHAPGQLRFPVRVPPAGRFDVGLGVLRANAPVTFRVHAVAAGSATELLTSTHADPTTWADRTLDLSRWAGETVELVLETMAESAGTVALWGTPTVSGAVSGGSPRPNVILYVIDAATAQAMSAYGYPRRTTPTLERLAAEGALFTHARSNSSWSKPSTASFMTSLQHTVLGGYSQPADPLPAAAPTAAELFHAAGYQTAVLTSNTWCGTLSSLDRGVDFLRETVSGPGSASSRELGNAFWGWRDHSPGEPFWVHFQTTDAHWPWEPVPPLAGTLMTPAERAALATMERQLGAATGGIGRTWAVRAPPALFTRAGVDREAYFHAVRNAYDEAIAHNDAELGRLVDELERRGLAERTLLIVTADHGDWPGLGYLGVDPAAGRVPFLNPFLTHVPLVMWWPGAIPAGTRIDAPVSLLDLLPTTLDLAGLPRPGHFQGQSLAPLLLDHAGWEPRPVVIDELEVDPGTGAQSGTLDLVDGRWGASLAYGTAAEGSEPLFLCDFLLDPYCQRSVHAEHPDLAASYRQRLERLRREYLALAKQFPRTAPSAMDAAQLENLRALGYLQ